MFGWIWYWLLYLPRRLLEAYRFDKHSCDFHAVRLPMPPHEQEEFKVLRRMLFDRGEHNTGNFIDYDLVCVYPGCDLVRRALNELKAGEARYDRRRRELEVSQERARQILAASISGDRQDGELSMAHDSTGVVSIALVDKYVEGSTE